MSSREQKLVNAQVSVNRAVFLMNYKYNDSLKEVSDNDIAQQIKLAVDELREAYNGYVAQKELF